MTLTYVVDCSLVIDALSAREEDEVLRQRLSAPRTLHAPHHLDVEVASAVRGLAAGKKIWSVPAFMDTELGCQLTELPIS